jgi:hypothetical protein
LAAALERLPDWFRAVSLDRLVEELAGFFWMDPAGIAYGRRRATHQQDDLHYFDKQSAVRPAPCPAAAAPPSSVRIC